MGRLEFAALVLASFVLVAQCRVMRWIPNTDFDNPNNWKTGKLPCERERVRFAQSAVSVFVQRNSTVMEIILPIDGELILGQGASISFSVSSSELDANNTSCPEQENLFTGSTPMSWFNPDNWCEMLDVDSEQCLPDQPRRLHVESIPCSNDDVVFPLASRFLIDIASEVEINIGDFHIGHEQYKQRELRQFLATDAGRRQFVRQPPGGVETAIRVTGDTGCSDLTGCACDNDALADKICSTQRSQCPPTLCRSPLEVPGHCCRICGAWLSIQFAPKFRIKTIENMVKNLIKNFNQQSEIFLAIEDEQLWWIVSKVDTEFDVEIEVVIADNNNGDDAISLARLLKEDLDNDIAGKARYRVSNVEINVSDAGPINPDAHTGEDTSSRKGYTIFIVLFVCLLVVAGVIWCFVTRRRRGGWREGAGNTTTRMHLPNLSNITLPNINLPSFTFPTFARWREDIAGEPRQSDMELGRRGVIFDNRTIFDDENAMNFENLGFDNVLALQQFGPLEMQPTVDVRAGINNPLYGDGPGVEEVTASRQYPCSPPTTGASSITRRDENALDNQARPREPASITSKVSELFRSIKTDSFNRERFFNEEEDENNTSKTANNDDKTADRGSRSSGVVEALASLTRQQRAGKTKEESDDVRGSKRKSDKKSSEVANKGIANPCYDRDVTRPEELTSEMALSADRDLYRTGFTNPVFE